MQLGEIPSDARNFCPYLLFNYSATINRLLVSHKVCAGGYNTAKVIRAYRVCSYREHTYMLRIRASQYCRGTTLKTLEGNRFFFQLLTQPVVIYWLVMSAVPEGDYAKTHTISDLREMVKGWRKMFLYSMILVLRELQRDLHSVHIPFPSLWNIKSPSRVLCGSLSWVYIRHIRGHQR